MFNSGKFNADFCLSAGVRIFHLSVVITLLLFTLSLDAAAESHQLKVLSWNAWNYFVKGGKGTPKKSEESCNAFAGVIARIDPDIILLCEMGGKEAVKDLVKRLEKLGIKYPFYDVMSGSDSWRHLAVIAKFKPKNIYKRNDFYYQLRPKNYPPKSLDTVPVQRGFFHLVFRKYNYTLHIVSAHLKSRLFSSRYNQTDMRRMEARQLRYMLNDILKKNSDTNLLVVGDLNDTYSSNVLKTITGSISSKYLHLKDLKPADKNNTTWTHWWSSEDSYGRIDYALVSESLLKKIDRKKTRIIHFPSMWMKASDHRPLLTVINCSYIK